MWAFSWAIVSATNSRSSGVAVVGVQQQQGLAVGDQAGVLHGALGEVRDGDLVELLFRVRRGRSTR